MVIRPAAITDLPRLTAIHNHYVAKTHITFDIEPFMPEERESWFRDHSEGHRYRLFVAEERSVLIGYATSGRFRPKAAYDTTVEVSIACAPTMVRRGVGTKLYQALFEAIANEDINRIVAGIAQPNEPSNALHEKFGFKRIGLFSAVGRKFGQYWDVLWTERPLRLGS